MMSKDSGFDEALERLEQIVNRLERDELSLEDALALFDEGLELVRRADRKLAESRGRLQQVLMDREGEGRTVDLQAPGEA